MRITNSTSSIQRLPTFVYLALFVILQFLIVGIAFMGGFLVHEWRYADGTLQRPGDYPVLSEAYDLLKDNAIFDLPDAKAMEYGMIRGMLGAANEPYTVFVEPPQHELQTNRLDGQYGGIGVRIDRDENLLVYLYPFENSPALEAGVRSGDRLLKIGDLVVGPETTNDEINSAIRGPVGENVTITVGHAPDYEPVDIAIERAQIGLPSVTANQIPGEPRVGLVSINVIASTTPDEIVKAVEELQALGATHFIIDVRNNGGGLVEAGVNTARLFLREGTVIEEQYRGKPVKTFAVEKAGPLVDLPIVVLTNRNTASAAEIFAGAIKAHERAPIVGSPTYGKDTIQLVFKLSDGSSLHVTAARWWVPGLEPKIGEGGVQPDVMVEEGTAEMELRKQAIETVLK